MRPTDIAQRQRKVECRPDVFSLSPFVFRIVGEHIQGVSRKQRVEEVLAERATETIANLALAVSCRPTHLESVEDDIQLDCVLATNRVVDLAGIGARKQDRRRNDKKQHPEDRLNVRLGQWREGFTSHQPRENTSCRKRCSDGENGEVVEKAVKT